MSRAAIYARFSSDLQSESSIDDQLALCRAYAEREGLTVIDAFADRAMSGATTVGRAGLEALIAGAKAGRYRIVVVEELDRLSRDMGDLSNIWKVLRHAGCEIVAVHEGKADQIRIGVRGLVGALYLTDLANKTRRGLAGKLRAGQRAGGLPYGYRPIAGRPGEHEIYESEAAIVRRIFGAYAEGSLPREIAAGLNSDNVPPPRGVAWCASSIGVNAKRGAGMLANEIYIGVIVWNRVSKVKHPETGKRVPRVNPQSEWQRVDAPHLAIIDRDLWERVQARLAARRTGPITQHRRPKRLLSGLLKCGKCGSGMASAGNDHGRPIARCSRFRESGACDNSRKVYLDTIERAVVDGLREHLAHPKIIAEAVREYHAERRRLSAELTRERAGIERRRDELARAIDRMIDDIAFGRLDSALFGPKAVALQAERETLDARLAASAAPEVVTLHPKALERYLAAIEALHGQLSIGLDAEAVETLRGLIDSIVIQPREAGEPVVFDIKGRLAELMTPPSVGSVVPGAESNHPNNQLYYFR